MMPMKEKVKQVSSKVNTKGASILMGERAMLIIKKTEDVISPRRTPMKDLPSTKDNGLIGASNIS